MLSLSLGLVDPSLTYCLRSLPIYKTKEGMMPEFKEKWLSVPLHRVASTQDQCRWDWIIDIVRQDMPEPVRFTNKQREGVR